MAAPTNWNASIIDELSANDGHVGGPFAGQELLLLHTAGAKSGQEPERTELFDDVIAAMPSFADYQHKTSRILPIILLTRQSSETAIPQPQ